MGAERLSVTLLLLLLKQWTSLWYPVDPKQPWWRLNLQWTRLLPEASHLLPWHLKAPINRVNLYQVTKGGTSDKSNIVSVTSFARTCHDKIPFSKSMSFWQFFPCCNVLLCNRTRLSVCIYGLCIDFEDEMKNRCLQKHTIKSGTFLNSVALKYCMKCAHKCSFV